MLAEVIGAKMANDAGYVAGGISVFLGMNADEWGVVGVLVGIAFMVLTYATNLLFKFRAEKRGS